MIMLNRIKCYLIVCLFLIVITSCSNHIENSNNDSFKNERSFSSSYKDTINIVSAIKDGHSDQKKESVENRNITNIWACDTLIKIFDVQNKTTSDFENYCEFKIKNNTSKLITSLMFQVPDGCLFGDTRDQCVEICKITISKGRTKVLKLPFRGEPRLLKARFSDGSLIDCFENNYLKDRTKSLPE